MIGENDAAVEGIFSETTSAPQLAGRLGGQALYVLAGNLFTLIVGLPLQVYVSRKLGTGGLGTYSLLEGIAATTAGLLGFGLAPTAVRFIPQYLEEGDYFAIKRLIVRGALALLLLGVAGYALFLFLLLTFSGRWGSRVDPVVLGLMGALIPLSLLTYFAQQSLRGFQEIRYLIIGSSFIQLSVKACATVVVFMLGARLAGYAAATVLASFVASFWMAAGLTKRVRGISASTQRAQSRGPWKRYAAINFATSLASLPSSYLDRFLLGFFVGAGPVGVLAVARQLQQLPAVLYQMLLSVAAPMFAGAHARGARSEQEHLYVLTTDWAVKAALPLVAFLFLFARPVLALFGAQFGVAGAGPLQVLLAAQLFNLASGPNGNLAMMSGLEREAFRIDLVTMAGTALLLLMLVPVFGLLGVALCVLANSIASNSWALVLVRTKLDIRWWSRRYLGWMLPSIATGGVGVLLWTLVGSWNVAGLFLALTGMYTSFAAVSWLQGLHDDDRELISLVKTRLAFR